MKKIILFCIALLAFEGAMAQISQIGSSKLPARARTTISKGWNNAPIVDAWRNKSGKRVEYKASLEDGSLIKFNAAGQWIEMKCFTGVPSMLLPNALVQYVERYYEGRLIVHATHYGKFYRVELSDGSKLEFTEKGIFNAFL